MGAGASYGTLGGIGTNNAGGACAVGGAGNSPAGTLFGVANLNQAVAFGSARGEGAIRLVSSNATLGAGLVTSVGAAGGICTCGASNSGGGGACRIAVQATALVGTTSPVFFGG